MTPLIDVLLVLIVMAVVALPQTNHSIDFGLQDEGCLLGRDMPSVVTLDVDFDGALLWDGEAISTRSALESKLATLRSQQNQTELYVRANKLAPYKSVAGVLASARRQGVWRLGLVQNSDFT
jgi:biopolymer transport protein ExbD